MTARVARLFSPQPHRRMIPARRFLSRPFLPPCGITSPRPIRRLTQAVGFWLLSMVVCVLAHAAEAIKKSFDLPADSIERSLKRFSAQSGLEVLFPTDTVAGV